MDAKKNKARTRLIKVVGLTPECIERRHVLLQFGERHGFTNVVERLVT